MRQDSVGDRVSFALQKSSVYIKDEHGTEHRLRVTKKVLKPITRMAGMMSRMRLVGLGAVLAGAIVLALPAIAIAIMLYYRPTIEYVYPSEQFPEWLTPGQIIGGILGGLAVGGALLLWAGVRRLRA